jgi:hypothetical protein
MDNHWSLALRQASVRTIDVNVSQRRRRATLATKEPAGKEVSACFRT